jgi:thioredoxin 1
MMTVLVVAVGRQSARTMLSRKGIKAIDRTKCTNQSFEEEILKRDVPVVVDFWAPWCGPSLMISPITEKLSNEYKGEVRFCKLNVDENAQAARQYQVMSIPLLLFFNSGEMGDESLGAVPENMIRPKVEALLQPNLLKQKHGCSAIRRTRRYQRWLVSRT